MRGRIGFVVAASGLLTACGGGGGGGVNSVSSTPTTATSTPTAPVTVIDYNDAEYQRSTSASDAKALVAYTAGATGAGVTIGIIDTGINLSSAEFTGRISAASAGFGEATAQDIDGHGTAVASVAAAGRNGNDILGVAFNATIAAMRVDTLNTCGTTDGCKFNNTNITNALDAARVAGAKVINISLGGGTMSSTLVAAVNRATAAGIIIVVSAGNDGTANPDVFTQVANQSAARGLVIIAGSHDATGTISSFSDKAGTYAQYYLTALGEKVRAPDQTGTDYLWSGTSFSAPEIAGAVALLLQAFPNLTPAQVVALLYSSATDAGATGIDPVYGNGILNLTKAFQPVGTTSLAGSTIAVVAASTVVTSTAMGDSTVASSALSHAVVIDGLGRAFSMNLIGGVSHVDALRPLGQAIGGDIRSASLDLAGIAIRTTVARGFVGELQQGLALQGRGYFRDRATPLSGSALVRVSPHLAAGFAFASGGQAIADLLAPDAIEGSYVTARSPRDTPGFQGRRAQAFALRQTFGRFEIGVTAERGTLSPVTLSDPTTPAYALTSVRVQRRFGPLGIGLGFAAMKEQATVLGARFGALIGGGGATTRYADADVRLSLGRGWALKAQWRQGWTDAVSGGVLASARLKTTAAAFDAGYAGQGHRFALRLALPPRVTGGGLNLTVPTAYDYDTGAVGYTNARLSLSPAGQERDLEANYGLRVAGGGWLDANAYWRRQPGNILLAPDDVGAVMRYSLSF